MTTVDRVFKNTVFLYGKMCITMFVSLYTTRLVLKAIGVSDFGIFNVVGGSIAMLGFLNAAMSSATQRFMSFYEGKGDKDKQKFVFNVSNVLHFSIALILGLLLLALGYFLFNGILNLPMERVLAARIVYGSLILSTMFTVVSVPYEAVLNAHENMLYYSIVGVIESFLKMTVAILVIKYTGDKLVAYGMLMAGIPFVSRTIMQVYCHRKYEECQIAPFKYWDKSLFKDMSRFAGWNFLSSASGILTMQGIGVILNIFFGVTVNAAQGVATQLTGQLTTFSNAMLKALNPVIVKYEGSNDRSQLNRSIFTGSKMSFVIMAVFSIPVIVEMPFFLSFWLGNAPEYAVSFARLNVLILNLRQLTVTLPVAIGATGDVKWNSVVESITYLLVLPLSVLFYMFYDFPEIIYIILLFFVAASTISRLFFSRKTFGLDVFLYLRNVVIKSLIPYVIVIVVFAYAEFLFEGDSFSVFLTIVFSSFLLYLPMVWFYSLDSEEKLWSIKLFRRVLGK